MNVNIMYRNKDEKWDRGLEEGGDDKGNQLWSVQVTTPQDDGEVCGLQICTDKINSFKKKIIAPLNKKQ